MSEPIVITLPLPSRDVSPNGRGHWAKKARAVKKHREWAWFAGLDTSHHRRNKKPLNHAESQVTFYFKVNRRRDADNHLASCKPYFDGLVDAGVLTDDAGLRHKPVEFKTDKANPRVEIAIQPTSPHTSPSP